MFLNAAPLFIAAVVLALPSDLERLQGAWLPTAFELGAELQETADLLFADVVDDADAPEERHLKIFKGDRCRIAVFQGDREFVLDDDVRVELVPDVDPKQITLRYSDGVLVQRGIYKFNGNQLIICEYIGQEDDRPSSFDELRRNDMLSVFERTDRD